MRNERIAFPGAGGRLSAWLSLPPAGDVIAYAVFAHCFTCSKDLKPVVNISRALTRQRMGVLRFDFTGLGESEGDFAETTFSANVADLIAAADFMAREFEAPSMLIGHSLGGAAALQAANRIKSIRAVATIGAPFEPNHISHLFPDALEEVEERGAADVVLAGRRFTVSREFIRDLSAHRMEETIARLGRPLLIFHSPGDDTVGIENAARIYRAARHPKSFISLDDADHLLLQERDSLYVGSLLATWVRRYIDPAARPGAGEDAGTPAGAFGTDVVAGGTIIADEPTSIDRPTQAPGARDE